MELIILVVLAIYFVMTLAIYMVSIFDGGWSLNDKMFVSIEDFIENASLADFYYAWLWQIFWPIYPIKRISRSIKKRAIKEISSYRLSSKRPSGGELSLAEKKGEGNLSLEQE